MGFNPGAGGAGGASGALAGAGLAAAMATGPVGWGALALGAAAGGGLGFAGGAFGGGDMPQFSADLGAYKNRQNEIDFFQRDLEIARQEYLQSLNSMYSTVFSQYLPQAQAQFAAQGKQVGGGAFGAELARQTSMYQSQLEPTAYQQRITDLNNVQGMRAQAYNGYVGASNQARAMNSQASIADQASMGGMFANVAGYAGNQIASSYNPNYNRNPFNRYRQNNLFGSPSTTNSSGLQFSDDSWGLD